jgi:hypothetical protein
MEGIYRKFDKYGVSENDEAMQALLGSGLEKLSPNAPEVEEWRSIVNQSHRKLGEEGVFDLALYERIQGMLAEYRAGQ